jgi:nucleotide-binding universal stress UspA family protein
MNFYSGSVATLWTTALRLGRSAPEPACGAAAREPARSGASYAPAAASRGNSGARPEGAGVTKTAVNTPEGSTMYKKILVPVDGSKTSLRGLDEAIRLARELGGKIRLLHVVNEFVLDASYSPDAYANGVLVSMRQGGQAVLDAAAAIVRKEGLEPECALIESIGGVACDIAVEQAKEWGADLIVMGTHGRRGFRRFVMGSDAEGVLRSATAPVLLVRSAA